MSRLIIISFSLFVLHVYGHAQINNLVHPKDYPTAPYGSLGLVEKVGNGSKDMVVISGLGFDGNLYGNLKVDSILETYTMHIVTLPGFGGTQAYPMPNKNEVYNDLYWTKGVLSGLKNLIEKEGMEDVVLLSYFTYSNVLALRLALDYPDLINKVIIVSGMAKFTATYPSYEPANLRERIYFTERVIAQNWWKEINREGWNQGSFSPDTYSLDSVRANQYWNQASEAPIPTMVRYLLEYYCMDLSLEYSKLQVPTLVIMPAFTREALIKPANTYLTHIFHQSWWGAKPSNSNFHLMTITDSHAFILDDQPAKVIDAINQFVNGTLGPYDLLR